MEALGAGILLMGVVMTPAPARSFDPGPAVGTALPAFSARDQTGRMRRFDDLVGRNGLVLVFFRSADW